MTIVIQTDGVRMKTSAPRAVAALAVLAVTFAAAACGGASRAATSTGLGSAVTPAQRSPAEVVAADNGIAPYTKADVDFVSGMIGHHAQAVLMAGWAQSHGASPSVQGLCERIVVAQRDEIRFMQRWLRERKLPVPDGDTSHMMMAGMDMKLMPGMLTPEQMEALRKAHGAEFDRLFLTGMIQHHGGALTMVHDLFNTAGSGQDAELFNFATDVDSGQRAEIRIMQAMLEHKAPEEKQ